LEEEVNFTTKIHLAPNLKNKMNFKGIEIEDNAFFNAKILYSTPIAKKFIKLFENSSKMGLITAFNIETQETQSIEQLDGLIKQKFDLFFLNLKDAYSILNGTFSIDQVDEKFKKYAKIRIYTAGKKGSFTRTDNFEIFFPGIEVEEVVDRTGAGDCFAAGFLTKLFELVKDKEMLEQLNKNENREKLKGILSKCVEFATYTAIYKFTNQLIPNQKEMEVFIKTFKIK
jgi:sugar/nucleoside kinase (ribokinase family)